MLNLDYREVEVKSPLGLHLEKILSDDKGIEVKELEFKDTFIKILMKHCFSIKVDDTDSEILIFINRDNKVKYGFNLEMPCDCSVVNELNKLLNNLEKIIQDFFKNEKVEDKKEEKEEPISLNKSLNEIVDKIIDILTLGEEE